MNSVRYPIRSGFVGHNGTPVWLDENTAWDGDDPFVRANADKFEERDAMGAPIVEAAPAEPVKAAPVEDAPADPVAEVPAAKPPARKPKNG